MSSSSSDPKVQHVWRLLAKASVEHELAHQQRHENATVARSHVHNAVKHTVRAAKAIRDTLETEEQFDLVMELESKFRPVLFKSIKDVIAQKRRLIGGDKNKNKNKKKKNKKKKKKKKKKNHTTEGKKADAASEEAKQSEEDDSDSENQEETEQPEMSEQQAPEETKQPEAPTAQKQSVPINAENLLSGLFKELEEAQKKHEEAEQALNLKRNEKTNVEAGIQAQETEKTRLQAYKSKVETQLSKFEQEYAQELRYREQVDQLNKRYGEKQEFLKIATKIRTSIFTPYVDRNTNEDREGPDINAVMTAFSTSDGNPFASPWASYPAIDKDVAAAWTAAGVKEDFKKLAGAAANESLVNTFQTVTENLTGIRQRMTADFENRQRHREAWRNGAATYQEHELTEDDSIEESLTSLNSVNISGDVSKVKVLLEDLSRAIRIVVRVLNRDIVDGEKIDYNPAVQKCSREGYIRWVNDEEQKQPTQTDPAQANLEFSKGVLIDQGSGGEKFYGPFFKVLAPTKNDGHTVTNPTNDEFYKQSIKPSVQNVLQGGSVMTVAYGYSGSGKTFGFFGDGDQVDGSLQMFLNENSDLTIKVRARELYGEAPGRLGCALENLTHLTGEVYEFDVDGNMGEAVGTNIAANLPDHLYYTVPDKWYSMWDMSYHGTGHKSVHDLPVGKWFYDEGRLGFVVGKFEHPTDPNLDRTIVAYETIGVSEEKPILHHEGTRTLFGLEGNALTEGSYYIMQQHHFNHHDRDVGTSFSVTNTNDVVKISSKNAEFKPRTLTSVTDTSGVDYQPVTQFRTDRRQTHSLYENYQITGISPTDFSGMGTVCVLSDSHDGQNVKLFAHCRCTELKDKMFEIQWKPISGLGGGGNRKQKFIKDYEGVTLQNAAGILEAWKNSPEGSPRHSYDSIKETWLAEHLGRQNADSSGEQKSPEQPDTGDSVGVAPEGVYSTHVHPLLTKRQRIMALDVEDESRWHEVENVVEYYNKVQASREEKRHIMATSNNPQSSRGHLALSLRVENGDNEGVWTILDMAGCERPVAIAREEICDDFDKSMTWNHYFREHSGESDTAQKLTDVGLLSVSCQQNGNLDLTRRLKRSAKVIQQGYFINESNNHFMSFLRSHDVETGTVNPQYGKLDKGMREYQCTKFGSRYETNGVATLLNNTSTHGKLVYRLGDLEDDQKYVLDNMYLIHHATFINSAFDSNWRDAKPVPLSINDVPEVAVFEKIQVNSELIEKLQSQSWNRFECQFQNIHPVTDVMKKGGEQKEGTDLLNIGSNSQDITFRDVEKYDSWMGRYYDESAKKSIASYEDGCLKIVTAYLIAKEKRAPHRMVLLRPQKDFYAWCGNVSAKTVPEGEEEEADYVYYDENGLKGGTKYRCPSMRTIELDVNETYDFIVCTGRSVEKKNKNELGGIFTFEDLLKILYGGEEGSLGRIIGYLSTPRTDNDAKILVYKKQDGNMIGCVRKEEMKELGFSRLDSPQNRMVLYLNSHSFSAKIVDGNWNLYLAGQEEMDREFNEYPTVRRLVGPNLSNSELVDPVGEEKYYNQKNGKSQQFTQHPNPLIVGPESALFYQSKPLKRRQETGFEEIAKYSRYDPNKMYSNPVAHLYGRLVEKHSNLEELQRMYAADEVSIPLIQASQRESIRRWNEWKCGGAGPEPLSGYVGMVDFCRGCTVQGSNNMPAKVVVCLTARSERIGDGSDKLRVSQALGVRETMRYADLLNPLSTRSIVQIQKGANSNMKDTWTFVTKNFPVQVRCSNTAAEEELLSSPSLYWSLKGGESLFHLDDLVPSSGDEETAEEESIVMEFDLGSERPSFW